MRIYLAARFGRQAELREYRSQLQALGHTVLSRWLDEDPSQETDLSVWRARAVDDLEDIRRCEVMLSFTDGEPARGGRHVETGIAIERGMRLVVIGPVEHVFHALAQARHESWEDFKAQSTLVLTPAS